MHKAGLFRICEEPGLRKEADSQAPGAKPSMLNVHTGCRQLGSRCGDNHENARQWLVRHKNSGEKEELWRNWRDRSLDTDISVGWELKFLNISFSLVSI